MNAAVNFQNQAVVDTDEVDNETLYRVLPTKLRSTQTPVSYAFPQELFSISWHMAHFTRQWF